MFTNFFNRLIKNINTNERQLENNKLPIFILNEFFKTVGALIWSAPKTSVNTNIILYKNNERINIELNKRLFYIREEFYENFNLLTFVFKTEWNQFYSYFTNFNKIKLIYTQHPLFYYANSFYTRTLNFKKIKKIYRNNIEKSNNVYWGLLSFWNALKIWAFSLPIALIFFYTLLVKRTGVLPQTLFFWIGLTMLLYWLLSGFVFFVKKYQFSRYTSVIQRFWRRSYILFWLIESGLLLVFFYLMINSSQESFYMLDQGYFLKTHLFSWKIFIFKCILVVSLITYSYLLLLNLKWSTFNRNILNLTILTVLLLYLLWMEFYQIYWVSNFYANFSWLYDMEESIWSLEFDARRTRILNHYIMVLFLLKFWHIVFIFSCWVFFLLRSNELETITYPLYSFNFQNFIILFLMMWLFMYPWFKQTSHWIMELPYFWFYVDIHISFIKILVYDIYNFYYSILNHLYIGAYYNSFKLTDFINWYLIDTSSDFNVYIKSTIKNEILKSLI